MKKYLICFLISMMCCGKLAADEVAPIPALSETVQITLMTWSGWGLTMSPDGSAVLIYGAADEAKIPAGTFAFSEIYGVLIVHLRKNPLKVENEVAVVIRRSMEGTAIAQYVDFGVVAEIFSKAERNWNAFDKERIEYLLRFFPIKDKPGSR